MRNPTHMPPTVPTPNAKSIGGMAFTNQSSPIPIGIMMARNTTTATTRQNMTVAGLKRQNRNGAWRACSHARPALATASQKDER